jgi:UDP-N-acetylglucosamine:LPS N-acetylglucosamine transferase
LNNRDGAKIIMENKIADELEEYLLSLNRKKCLSMAENAKVRRRQEACKKIYEYISNNEK